MMTRAGHVSGQLYNNTLRKYCKQILRQNTSGTFSVTYMSVKAFNWWKAVLLIESQVLNQETLLLMYNFREKIQVVYTCHDEQDA